MDLEKLAELWLRDESDVRLVLDQVTDFMDDIGASNMQVLPSGEKALVLPYDAWDVAGKLFYLCNCVVREHA